MSKLTRRDFIKSSMIAGASLAVATPFSKVRGANNDIRVAVIGVGGKGRFGGTGHCSEFHKIEGVRVVAVCDADQDLVDRAVEDFKKQNVTVKGYRDMRKILGDKEIDAISTATPDQWHALVTIWGCQAGKDVYVEKPTSHNIWEGRKMVEAARKYNRIVQNGTMRRSSDAYREAYEYINQGNIGKILWVRGFCYKDRFVDPVKAKGVVPGTGGPNPVRGRS